ncbi:hypothetical protein SAMN04488126_11245 [Bhargavaea beijingensis]|uniref:Uncharacterized protein n=1 Tax=Bhargavaea beijingensis TaxID=426756 RepID=A0A1G7E349_9BACL|nr:hypothetical protein SAMN04488126_11245 [Bhargavaea beijingensis]
MACCRKNNMHYYCCMALITVSDFGPKLLAGFNSYCAQAAARLFRFFERNSHIATNTGMSGT